MNIIRGDKKDEDVDPFANLDKSTVFQDTRAFNSNVINARKCTTVLTKVLYVLNQVGKRMLLPHSGPHTPCIDTLYYSM
jgi:hypothetical protein